MTKQIQLTRQLYLLIAAAVLLFASLVPFISFQMAGAAQLESRSVTIDKSYPEATDVEYDFSFDIPTGGGTAVQGIRIQWCTSPLGTCTTPSDSGTAFTAASATVDEAVTNWSEATAFTDAGSADEGDCTEATNSVNEVCLERSDTDAETAATKTITLSGIDHPDDLQTVYVRIGLYSDTAFATLVHDGVVAAAIVNQITVTARVQERLVFCVGTFAGNADPEDCGDISGTTEDLGAVDFLAVCATGAANPCETNTPGDTDGSFALIATNAQEGAVVSYYAEDDTTGGAADHLGSLRIPGADCDATDPSTDETDQCFNSAGWDGSIVAGVAIAAGDESFGMTVADVTTPAGGLTSNLTRDTVYDGDGSTGGACTAANAGTDEPCWVWNESGTADIIATSSGVLDNEALDIRFAATASLTTPTGQYAVTSTYVATPTF